MGLARRVTRAGTTHVSIAPSGAWVFAANYTAGNASVIPLAASGALGAIADTEASGAKSHWAGTNPSGTHVFVPALGANSVRGYALDAATGALTPSGSVTMPAGAGPRHMAFHPSEKWAYVVNETAVTVTKLDFDRGNGALTVRQTVSALPPGQSTADVSGAEIAVHPTGRWVYASTRVYDSIAHFAVDAASGALSRVGSSTTGANRPRSFAIDPAGGFLFAGNEDADHVVGFRIDGATGALAPLGKIVDVPRPTFVGVAQMR